MNTRKKICGIYKITNTLDGKVYIGQSVDIVSRFYRHKEMLKGGWHHNEHMLSAYNKYGPDVFKYEVIEECSIDELDEREMFYISLFDSTNKANGYNKNAGGQGRHDCPEETRKRISEAKKRNPYTPVYTEERRRNLSEHWHERHKEDRQAICRAAVKKRSERGSLSGERNGNAIISNDTAEKILISLYNGMSAPDASRMYGVSYDVVKNLQQNRSYRALLPELREEIRTKQAIEFSKHVDEAVKMYESGISQAQVARALGISRNTLRRELIARGIDTQIHLNQSALKEVV